MPNTQGLIKQATTICEAATPGPFRMESQVSLAGEPRYCIKAGPDGVRSQIIAEEISDADARLFATARTLVPELAAALEELTRRHKMTVETKLFSRRKLESDVVALTRERDEARAELTRTKTWDTPRHAPKNGESLRLWIDECDGFEHPDKFFAEDSDGLTIFRCESTRRSCSAALWRYADSAPRPADVTVARSHAEFEEDDA